MSTPKIIKTIPPMYNIVFSETFDAINFPPKTAPPVHKK